MRTILANTRHREAIQAAAKAAGMQCALRFFSPPDLMELKAPVVLAFDADGKPDFEPDFLQYLRRTHPGGVRYSPAVVFCSTKEEMAEWRAAGAHPVSAKATQIELVAAIKAAVLGARQWVASTVYVGPDRRGRKALLALRKRRREDGAAAAAKNPRGGVRDDLDVRVSSPTLVHRRISLAAQLVQGSSIESRRAFRTMIDELEATARVHGRSDLLGIARSLRVHADRLVKDGVADMNALEATVAELAEAISRQP